MPQKVNDGVQTSDIRLSDYENIWTKFCFLDETGDLTNAQNPYFTVGLIKMSQPYYLQNKIAYERSCKHFHDELKFNKLSKANIGFAKFVINSFFDTKNVDFYSYTTHKESKYYHEHFKSNQWAAYEEITLKLLDNALSTQEILVLLADYVTTPDHVRFEVDVKRRFNAFQKRLALAGVCRFDSKSNDLLQVVDLIIGCISYDLKLTDGLVSGDKYKIELLNCLKENLGTKTFSDGFRNRNFSIFVERDHGEIISR